jgi:hypothetical protein
MAMPIFFLALAATKAADRLVGQYAAGIILISLVVLVTVAALILTIFVPFDRFAGRVIEVRKQFGHLVVAMECYDDEGEGWKRYFNAGLRSQCYDLAPVTPRQRKRFRFVSAGYSEWDRSLAGTYRHVSIMESVKPEDIPQLGDVMNYSNSTFRCFERIRTKC